MARQGPIVTDHALIRWLERRHGFNMDELRAEATREIEDFAGSGCKSVVVDGLMWLLEGYRATTVLPAGSRPVHQDRGRRHQGIADRHESVAARRARDDGQPSDGGRS